MKPDVVADVGNTRIKWGRCDGAAVVESAGLPPADEHAWLRQLQVWQLHRPCSWAIGGVHPHRQEALAAWLCARGHRAKLLSTFAELAIAVCVERPECVGLDRLFNAVAARSRCPAATPAVLIDAGSAVTVDWLDETGAFRGGAIAPGMRLMARSLKEFTALLPLIEVTHACPALPGVRTSAAIEAGVFWSVAGGISTMVEQLTSQTRTPARIFLTGGDAPLLLPALPTSCQAWPTMTLEGIRLAAEALP
jgi:type III pantothenate kinase